MKHKNLLKIDEDRRGTLSHPLTEAQEQSAQVLRDQIKTLAARVRSSRLSLQEKVKLLNSLVKSHESLTKTERMTAGLDDRRGSVVNAGVIVIPPKADHADWHSLAVQEVEASRDVQPQDHESQGSRAGTGDSSSTPSEAEG